jgi:hypothetical protein
MKSVHPQIAVCALALAMLGIGCSSSLTRNEAQRQLDASYTQKSDYVYVTTGNHPNMLSSKAVPYLRIFSGMFDREVPETAALSSAGFLKVTVIASGVVEQGIVTNVMDHVTVEPTDKAKPFIAGIYGANSHECRDGCIKLIAATPKIEITGITEPADGGGQKMCTVTFHVNWQNTAVGTTLNRTYPALTEEQSTFVKYDNGWRLQK